MKQWQADRLQRYAALIRRYHGTLDLMSPAAVAGLETKLSESLAYAEVIADELRPGDVLLDLGSGVGLPGIPLAICFPEHRVVLVERRRKRANFLRLTVGQLGLANVKVFDRDVREVALNDVAVVTAQAVDTLLAVYCLTRHLHAHEVRLVARKGPAGPREAHELAETLKVGTVDFHETHLGTHGRLVALTLPGGLPCPSSA